MGLMAVGLIGAGLSAVGQIAGGISQANQASYQAQVARNNQTIANQNAEYAAEAGSADATLAGERAKAQLGKVTAGYAANNIDVNTGSPEEVRKSTAETGELEQLTTEQNALLNTYGYKTQATSFGSQAQLEQYQAATAIPGSLLGAAGSFASNASLLPLKYQFMANSGGGGSPLADANGPI